MADERATSAAMRIACESNPHISSPLALHHLARQVTAKYSRMYGEGAADAVEGLVETYRVHSLSEAAESLASELAPGTPWSWSPPGDGRDHPPLGRPQGRHFSFDEVAKRAAELRPWLWLDTYQPRGEAPNETRARAVRQAVARSVKAVEPSAEHVARVEAALRAKDPKEAAHVRFARARKIAAREATAEGARQEAVAKAITEELARRGALPKPAHVSRGAGVRNDGSNGR